MIVPFDAPLAQVTSAADGTYLFSDLTPGRYFVRVPAWQFDFGMPLYQHASSLGLQTGDDQLGEDGIDDGSPSANGVQTAVFELSAVMIRWSAVRKADISAPAMISTTWRSI